MTNIVTSEIFNGSRACAVTSTFTYPWIVATNLERDSIVTLLSNRRKKHTDDSWQLSFSLLRKRRFSTKTRAFTPWRLCRGSKQKEAEGSVWNACYNWSGEGRPRGCYAHRHNLNGMCQNLYLFWTGSIFTEQQREQRGQAQRREGGGPQQVVRTGGRVSVPAEATAPSFAGGLLVRDRRRLVYCAADRHVAVHFGKRTPVCSFDDRCWGKLVPRRATADATHPRR